VRRARGGIWAATVLLVLGCGAHWSAQASGASPYLPLNLSPEIERKIERVLVLGGRPVMTRPVPVAKVMLALPKACRRDVALCAEVKRYLERYFRSAGLTHASGDVAAASKSKMTLPNERGERVDSPWDASAVAFYRPFDHLLLQAGGVDYGGTDRRFNPAGTLASLGDQYFQLDAGYRDHWFSPLTDSSMLQSTEAPTMPSITVSNQSPIGGWGFQYELFLARMSYTDQILYQNELHAGYPRLVGMHFGLNPVENWAIALNGTWQFGGGGRPGSFKGFIDSLFKRTPLIVPGTAANTDSRFSNRTVSITSAYTFSAPTPFEAYAEYSARDTLHGELFRFHQSSLSTGVHFPQLWEHFDLTVEASEWQENQYSDYVWQEGMTEYGYVTGNWGADWRSGDPIGAESAMAQLGWELQSGNSLNLRYRTLQNQDYYGVHYERAHMVTLEYAQPRNGYTRGLQLDAGRDVYGSSYARLSAFARFDGGNQDHAGARAQEEAEDDRQEDQQRERQAGAQVANGPEEDDEDEAQQARERQHVLERFVDLGISGGRLGLNLGGFTAAEEKAPLQYRGVASPHLGLGVRGAVTEHGDLGVRLDVDDFRGAMLGLRVIDYRYRLDRHLALGVFFGFARYSGPTPAQGYYAGAGLQWRDLLPHWDLSFETRYFDHLQRDKLLASDPQNGDIVEWYMLQAPTLSLSRRF
jgi:hypothetical protein